MNKKILFFFAFVICYNVKGQYLKNDFSINFSPSISSFFGNSYLNEFKSRLTFSYGASYSYYCSEKVFLQSGILFERKGAKVGVDFFDNNGNYYKTSDIIFNRDYLVVPVVCSFITKTRVKFYFGGGLFLGYLLSAKDLSSIVPIKESLAAETQQIDFGINLGLGFYVPINNRFFLDLGIKDNLGLFDTLINDLATKNNTTGLQMGLKYKF